MPIKAAILILLVTAAAAQTPEFRSGTQNAPVLIFKTEPEYPLDAQQNRVEGKVTLYVVVGTDGRIQGNIRVLRTLGRDLDEKAIECVRKWRFQPGTRDGIPMAMTATIEIAFPPGPPNKVVRV